MKSVYRFGGMPDINNECRSPVIGILSRGMLRLPFLSKMLEASIKPVTVTTDSSGLVAIGGWGRRPSAGKALFYSRRHSLPYFALEDGFLRSYATGDRCPPLSILLDEIGIYYDSTSLSALESLLASTHDVLTDHEVLVDQALRVLREKGLSK